MNSSDIDEDWFLDIFKNFIDDRGNGRSTTWVYIIIKKFGAKLYAKIGRSSGTKSNRLHAPLTYLTPPHQDSGYSIRNIIVFPNYPYEQGGSYASILESSLHKAVELNYPNTRVRHHTNINSEWFLVKNSKKFNITVQNEIGRIQLVGPDMDYVRSYMFTNDTPKTPLQTTDIIPSGNLINYTKKMKELLILNKNNQKMNKRLSGNAGYFSSKLKGIKFTEQFDEEGPKRYQYKIVDCYYSQTDKVFVVDFIKVTDKKQTILFAMVSEVLKWLSKSQIKRLGLKDQLDYYTKMSASRGLFKV
jgi:hypothetical protein